eukprot:CAMPEP_0171756422 /NCGR_PEP_ID=MMETSP0991-20121206/45064_1 /TAXON_ID=483369 /ORGANISM="non described non described, Strain CCMP2098" /LENGTH=89 /DNA_ID=CAMNT_0012358717 /DNA_START=139 /DNA_END=408 /DNA_ORIENTATION=+
MPGTIPFREVRSVWAVRSEQRLRSVGLRGPKALVPALGARPRGGGLRLQPRREAPRDGGPRARQQDFGVGPVQRVHRERLEPCAAESVH